MWLHCGAYACADYNSPVMTRRHALCVYSDAWRTCGQPDNTHAGACTMWDQLVHCSFSTIRIHLFYWLVNKVVP